jgi:NAD+ synthase
VMTIQDLLALDAPAAIEEIVTGIRNIVFQRFRRKGVVIGLSGGIDSSVVAALCVKALGADRVFGLLMPERECSPESLDLGRLLADSLGVRAATEDITSILESAGCYRRRDEAIQSVVPGYTDKHKCKIMLADVVNGAGYQISYLVTEAPDGSRKRTRLTADAYRATVAANNFKQRTRKMLEYYHADRLHFAVCGTPNRLEHDQGFFVKNGDGAADLKPIAHLYKTQVYQIAAHLGVPNEIRRRPPTTDTYSLEQSQEEFFFCLPYREMDLCLWGRDQDLAPDELGPMIGLSIETVSRAYRMIDAKRKSAGYLHEGGIGIGGLGES